MQLAFKNRPIRHWCENEKAAIDEFGVEIAAQLRARLADLHALEAPAHLFVGSPRLIEGSRPTIEISLGDAVTLTLKPNHLDTPRREDGRVHWERVRRVQVLSISDHSDAS